MEFSLMIERFLATTTITFFYFQAPVINALAGILNCSRIENESYITDYLLEQCTNNARYSEWRKILVLPTACFFVLILPAWSIYYMNKNKERIFNKEVICKVGFLLNGYSPQVFYWYIFFLQYFYFCDNIREFFFLLKKIAIILIIAFANVGYGQILYQNNGFFILILTCLCFWIQVKRKPFITDELNSLDLKGSVVMIITIFGGLFSSICEDLTLQTILMVIVILINVYFLALFLKTYLQIKLTFVKDSKFRLFKLFGNYWTKGILLKYLSILMFF